VQDSFPFPIALSWKGPAPESDGGEEASPNSIVFVKGNPIPSTKMLTFYRSGTFSIDVLYVDTSELPPLTTPKISTFTIGPFTPSKGEKAKLKVKIRLNLHGIVSVESATVIEEEEVEVPVTKSVTKESKEVPTSEVHQDGEGKDVKMDDVEANGPRTENDLPSAEEKPGLDSSKVDHSLLFFLSLQP
jgi:heat shock protein 4